MQNKKTLIVIAGPTAIGKTALAIKVAQHYQTEIISADSRQFFKEMNIGTAKPNQEELAQAKHHFIGSHSIHQELNVGSYEKEALEKIASLFLEHDVLVMVGGSGLYINAVLYGFDELPKADENLREKLNQQLKDQGIEKLQIQLKELDPHYYAEVDIQNPQRIIRALEVCISTGKTFSSFRKTKIKQRPFNTILIGLNTDRAQLYDKINLRVDQMVLAGLVEEATNLKEFKDLNALKTVGYSELFQYLDNKISLAEAIDKIQQNTRNFAKRQLTWLRKYTEIHWFEPNDYPLIIDTIDLLIDSASQKKS